MRRLFTILFIITVLGSINWLLESIGYNVISSFFSVKDKKERILSRTGHIIYFIIAFSAIVCAILFFREKMYKDGVSDPLNNGEAKDDDDNDDNDDNNDDKDDKDDNKEKDDDEKEEKETPAPTTKPEKMKSSDKKDKKDKK